VGSQSLLVQENQYAEAVVSRLDFPANYGTAAVQGPFVLTANVTKVNSLPSGLSIPTPPYDPLPAHVPLNSPLTFALGIDGLPNTIGTKVVPPLTFDGFSLTPANQSGGLALTVHAALSNYDWGKWSQAHPSGANAMIRYGYAGGDPTAGTLVVMGTIQLIGVTIGSFSVDPAAVAGGSPTTATAQLKAQHVSMVVN
jgi:hypothetical protein